MRAVYDEECTVSDREDGYKCEEVSRDAEDKRLEIVGEMAVLETQIFQAPLFLRSYACIKESPLTSPLYVCLKIKHSSKQQTKDEPLRKNMALSKRLKLHEAETHTKVCLGSC